MTKYDDLSVKLSFTGFSRFAMGGGFVAFRQSKAENEAGRYDPHIMFVHDDCDSDDEDTMKAVENDCAELARLLNKFRIANQWLTDKAKACAI